MNFIYNNICFQKAHSLDDTIIQSNIQNLIHSSKLIKSNIKDLYYSETIWGYSYPNINSQFGVKDIWNKWSDFCKNKNIVAEIIKIPPFLPYEKFDTSIFDEIHLVSRTCALELKNQDFLGEINQKTRYIIKKSEKNIFCRRASLSDANDIYKMYFESMQKLKANKKYYLGLNTFEFLCQNKNSEIYLAYFGDLLIGFVCFLFDKEISHYHLSATNEIGRKYNANYLLLYKAINKSIKTGKKLVHFGGGVTNLENDPLFKFKSKFSNSILEYRIGLAIHNKSLFNKFRNKSSSKIIEFIDK